MLDIPVVRINICARSQAADQDASAVIEKNARKLSKSPKTLVSYGTRRPSARARTARARQRVWNGSLIMSGSRTQVEKIGWDYWLGVMEMLSIKTLFWLWGANPKIPGAPFL